MSTDYIEKSPEVIIVGGGAAGLMCAYTAACNGNSVRIFEPNRMMGRKLRITGKGRCNVTNSCDVQKFMQNIVSNSKFLYSSISRFSPADTVNFFENVGVKLKVERGNRVFPVSDNANEVADKLTELCKDAGVVFSREKVKEICYSQDQVTGVRSESGYYPCSSVVVCTGGTSYPKTGSNGDGYRFAKAAGHSIIAPRASLVPLECAEQFCEQLQGVSLRNVTLSLFYDGKKVYSELGEMLFTHFGISGPLVLSASCHMKDNDFDKYRIDIDLKPGLDEQKLEKRILRDFEKYVNREFKNSLDELVARALIPYIIERSEIPENLKVNSITKEQRKKLVQTLKCFTLHPSSKRPMDEAIVTAGGVSCAEINPRTMESKIKKGLFFAGEVIDVDGYTGGFNLQIAWCTGYVAGNSVY